VRACLLALALALLPAFSGAAPAAKGAPTILWPAPGFGAPKGAVWLVVRAPTRPRALLDGRLVAAPAEVGEGVYHVRVAGVRPGGARLEVEAGTRRAAVAVTGEAGAVLFHARPPEACASCHDLGPGGCGECHRWAGARHPTSQPRECGRCHAAGQGTPRVVPPLCQGCHPKHSASRHPKLRHPVSAAQDPARPGRPFDCASCHDPHAPAALGRIDAEAKKRWCKGCHRK
jgi:predicted CXXCH cytochrome family protein